MEHSQSLNRESRFTLRNIFIFGFVVVCALTLLMLSRGRERNFMIFAESTQLFWRDIIPYGDAWRANTSVPLDYYLYGPLFNVLFAPFAFAPHWVGALMWNLFNYVLFSLAIYTLPAERFPMRVKRNIFLFVLPTLFCTLIEFQFNPTVALIFLFSYSLLERGQRWSTLLAITLILISGYIKIYGLFQLALLICYPNFWRNILYVVGVSVVLLLMPALSMPLLELPSYYGVWVSTLAEHTTTRTWESIFYMKPFMTYDYKMPIQLFTLAISAICVVLSHRRFGSWRFRTQLTGIIMGWIILFSTSVEANTYIVALAGYMLWYWSREERTIVDRVLFWLALAILGLMPIDIICPVTIMSFFFDTLTANIWVFTIIWLRMFYLSWSSD